MKTLIRLILLILLVPLPSLCQGQTILNQTAIRKTAQHTFPNESGGLGNVAPSGSHLFVPLPQSVKLPSGVDSIPVNGTWPQQSNSRALHNIQVDPSNPNNIHAVITGLTDNSGKDVGSLTRHCFYTFSSDAGKHWKAPVILSQYRSGYADMQLVQRSPGVWIPVIAAHHYLNSSGSQTESALWVEKGNPGDGNFAQCEGSGTTMEGSISLIIWPCIAVSPDGKSVYMIASVSPATSGGAEDQLQFGVWNLSADTAVFQGWTAEPGSTDANNGAAGITSGGAYRIEVSKSGHIGVMWENTQSSDGSIYFSESTDGGNNWSSTIPYILEGASFTSRTVNDNSGNTYSWTPSGSLDFWYVGDVPHFIYVGDFDDAGGGLYFPYSTSIYYVPDPNEGDSIMVANAALNAGTGTGAVPNILDLSSNVVNLQELPICYPTVATTGDTTHFAVFFQTHIEGDTEVFTDDTGSVTFAYGSIFYSATTDGGNTWTDPQPFMVNDPTASQKFDFRYPQTSSFNPFTASEATYHTAISIDTAAGEVDSVGQPGFDVIGYGHAVATVTGTLGVSNNGGQASLQVISSYPNPFASATTIQFTLPNESNVLLTVTDVLGRTVATLVDGRLGAGEHSSTLNAGDLPNGVYRYTLQADGVSISGSMSLLR